MNSVTKKLSFSLVICLALTSLMIPCASADKIYLKNGGVIETTMCWEETGRVYYVKCYDSIEITINIDKKDVKKIIKEDGSDQAYQKEKTAWDKKGQEPERVRIEKDKEAKNAKDDRKIHVQKAILGSTKAEVIEMFKGWKRSYTYESKIDPNAIKFENKDLIVVIDFDKEKRAEGVSFLSISGLDDWTGKKSYVNKNYEKLLYWATGGKRTKIDHNKSTQYPVEVYIGNIHEDEETETVRIEKEKQEKRVTIEKHLHNSQQSMAKKKFAQDLVASVPGVINAWWSQDISLWVEIDITTFASNPKLYAQQIADKLSWAASKKFGYVCVHVYYGKLRQLATSCG